MRHGIWASITVIGILASCAQRAPSKRVLDNVDNNQNVNKPADDEVSSKFNSIEEAAELEVQLTDCKLKKEKTKDSLEIVNEINTSFCQKLNEIQSLCLPLARLIPDPRDAELSCSGNNVQSPLAAPTFTIILGQEAGNHSFTLWADDIFQTVEPLRAGVNNVTFKSASQLVLAPELIKVNSMSLRVLNSSGEVPQNVSFKLMVNNQEVMNQTVTKNDGISSYDVQLGALFESRTNPNCLVQKTDIDAIVIDAKNKVKNKIPQQEVAVPVCQRNLTPDNQKLIANSIFKAFMDRAPVLSAGESFQNSPLKEMLASISNKNCLEAANSLQAHVLYTTSQPQDQLPTANHQEMIEWVYDALIGRVPTPEEVNAALPDVQGKNMAALVDKVLQMDEFSSRFTVAAKPEANAGNSEGDLSDVTPVSSPNSEENIEKILLEEQKRVNKLKTKLTTCKTELDSSYVDLELGRDRRSKLEDKIRAGSSAGCRSTEKIKKMEICIKGNHLGPSTPQKRIEPGETVGSPERVTFKLGDLTHVISNEEEQGVINPNTACIVTSEFNERVVNAIYEIAILRGGVGIEEGKCVKKRSGFLGLGSKTVCKKWEKQRYSVDEMVIKINDEEFLRKTFSSCILDRHHHFDKHSSSCKILPSELISLRKTFMQNEAKCGGI